MSRLIGIICTQTKQGPRTIARQQSDFIFLVVIQLKHTLLYNVIITKNKNIHRENSLIVK